MRQHEKREKLKTHLKEENGVEQLVLQPNVSRQSPVTTASDLSHTATYTINLAIALIQTYFNYIYLYHI